MSKKWIAAYYPSSLIENKRTRTLFCLLFDKVILHFPISSMACGGGSGISNDFADDILVDEGVIELREEFLLDEIDIEFTGDPWGTEEEFNRYYDLNVTGMALQCCGQQNAVPVTDRQDSPLPVSFLPDFNLKRAANLQAGAIAIQSLDLALPSFSGLESNDIMRARELLKDHLVPFRSAMMALSPKIRAGLDSDSSIHEVFNEARYLAQTNVVPQLEALKLRLKKESGVFWRKILQKGGKCIPRIALKWITTGGLTAATDAIETGSDIALQSIDREKLRSDMLMNGGLGYLVEAGQIIETDHKRS